MESSDRKNVYLTKTGDNSLNSGMRETMIVGQTNMAPGIYSWNKNCVNLLCCLPQPMYFLCRMWWRGCDEAQ